MENYNKYIAELFGTAVLSLTVMLSVSTQGAVSTPMIAAMVLGIFVYTIGSVSGCHINPGVTVGLWSMRRISSRDAIAYITAQIVGAALAICVVLSLFEATGSFTFIAPESLQILFAEFIGMAIFTFGIASVVFGKVDGAMSGVVIGGSLFLGIMTAAMLGSAGILNPAVAFALGSISASYIGGIILGSLAGMWLYKVIVKV